MYQQKKLWDQRSNQNFTIKDGVFTFIRKPGDAKRAPLLRFGYSTILTAKLNISFDYYLEGTGAIGIARKSFSLSSGAWKKIIREVPVKISSQQGFISFNCKGKLKVKNLVITSIKPENTVGKKLLIDGKEVKAIYYIKTSKVDSFFDYRAASIIQKYLYIAGGGILPVKELKKGQKLENGIVIGQAAKSYINKSAIKKVAPGGFALNVDNGIAAIYGAAPSGAVSGVFALLKKIGFFYLTNVEYVTPKQSTFILSKYSVIRNPAIALRLDGWPGGASFGMGMSDPISFARLNLFGNATSIHTIPHMVPRKEFEKTNLDFFAMQKNGQRCKTARGDVHYCLSNEKLQNLLTKRVKDFLKTDPICQYVNLVSGDGGSYYCRCENCKKLGSPTDCMVFFVNSIAKKFKKTHPHIQFTMIAYVDTRKAPVKYKLESNVIALYCPYGPVWNNHLQTYHKDNKHGLQQLKNWVKKCPNNMGAFVYPSSCPERLNVWPSFYANYEKIKYFGEHKFKIIKFCGLRPWGEIVPGSAMFNPVQRYVLTQVIWNPELNVEKALDSFFKLYYGKGAPALRKLFNLLHSEVKKQNWSQNTEKVIRGFMNATLADKCFKLYDEAAKAVGNSKPYSKRVKKEKLYILWSYLSDVNRANGKLKPANFSKYAKRLSEFCRLSKKYTILYGGRFTFKQWLWNTAMVKIPAGGRWYNHAVISKLIANPENTLGKSIPRAQVKTDYGYMIPAKGMFGGKTMKSSWLRRKTGVVKQLYRPSSGHGMVKMLLTLKGKLSKAIVIKVKGIDNEKKGVAMMKLVVNGKKVYEGKAPWTKDGWSFKEFSIPAKFCKKGDNEIQFLNITSDKNVFSQGRAVSRNYYWGWYMIDECRFYTK